MCLPQGRLSSASSSIRPPTASGFAPAPAAPGVAGLSAFEAEVVAVFADLVVLLGLPKSMGEIYGLVFASAEPPSFGDIEQKLGLSKGSVSQGLRSLRELGAIREAGSMEQGAGGNELHASVPPVTGLSGGVGAGLSHPPSGSTASGRATRWVATTELRQLIGTLLRERLTPYLERQDQRMKTAEAALAAEAGLHDVKTLKALQNRFQKLQTWQSRARTVLPVIGKML